MGKREKSNFKVHWWEAGVIVLIWNIPLRIQWRGLCNILSGSSYFRKGINFPKGVNLMLDHSFQQLPPAFPHHYPPLLNLMFMGEILRRTDIISWTWNYKSRPSAMKLEIPSQILIQNPLPKLLLDQGWKEKINYQKVIY